MIQELIEMSEIIVLALTLIGEAEGEAWKGKCAVADVIYNRAAASGRTLKDECLRPRQFSCWNGEAAQRRLVNRTADGTLINDQSWKDCLMIARRMASGAWRPGIKADHYYNPDLCSPSWAQDMRFVAVIGNHRFMKGK
ncbi:MAG: cell wall hydrolase [Candidatus Omnitrophica bacterium]|jgi:spore germination cell wall hydrolase CwlJ-like protein|nr:cell wall hydrolase [Candidatus Omnitrophota bacterium]